MAGLIQQAQGPRKADQGEQKQFELAVQQATDFLMEEENIKAMAQMAHKSGPAKAIALFVKKILDGVHTAAGGSGVNVEGHTMTAAAQIVSQLAATILVQGGFEGDPKQIAQEAVQMMEQM